MAAKLMSWCGRHIATVGRDVLVKDVLTSLAIYHLTPLDIPIVVLRYIDKLRRMYLRAASDKVSGDKCKIGWDKVCRPWNP